MLTLDSLMTNIQQGEVKDLNLVLKTGVQGSIEPLRDSINRLGTEEVRVNVVYSGSGGINESDVLLALASKGIVLGFDATPTVGAQRLAQMEGVDIRSYSVIYDLLDDIGRAVKGLKEPVYAEVIDGHAEVRAVFPAGRHTRAAGVYVTDGKLRRDDQVRVMRKKHVVHQGTLSSLRRFKDDVKEVATGFECGLTIDGFNAFEEGDTIEGYRMEKVDEPAS